MTLANKISPDTIGRKLCILRHILGYTQAEFAESIMMARPNLTKLENVKNNNEIKIDTLLRLYYAMSRLADTSNVDYVKSMAHDIIDDIITMIEC